jgi:NDP-sugar pyrophosphorylase family protein
VIVLAGGLGTRLRSLVPDRPKVLAPIDNVPFLHLYLDWLARYGTRRVILSLGYRAEMVQTYLESMSRPSEQSKGAPHPALSPSDGERVSASRVKGSWEGVHGKMEIETYVEASPLGTGGAVRAVLPLLRSETALVTNGDSLTRLDLCRFLEFHRGQNARLSMVLTYRPQVGASGVVETATDGQVISFVEKPSDPGAGGYINAGLYLLQREAIEKIPEGRPVSMEKEVFPQFCGRGFYALKGNFPFIDIGTPESYRRAGEFFREEAA